MKLTHLIKQIQNDLVDSQWKSYRHSQGLYRQRKSTDFLPTPVAKDLDVELTLHFAIENHSVKKCALVFDQEPWEEGLQEVLQALFHGSMDRYDIKTDHDNNKIELLTRAKILSTIQVLRTQIDNLFNQNFELDKQLFINLLKENYREYILELFPNRIILDKNEDGVILGHFESHINKKMHSVEALIKSCLSPSVGEDLEIIIDANALANLPSEAIQTAKLNIKVQDIEDDYETSA